MRTKIEHGVIFRGNTKNINIGAGCKIESGVIFECPDGKSKITIGDYCTIKSGVYLDAGSLGTIKIGNRVSINPYCVIYGHGGLSIGDDVRIATQTVIIPANHKFSDVNAPMRLQGLTRKGILISSNVWIGCGVKILDGVSIGYGSILAAGSVVTKEVGEFKIVAGVPAKVISERK